jgi:CHASE3 domain sensor protein
MPETNRYGDHLKEWEKMDAALTANADDLPQLAGSRSKLADLLEDFRQLLQQQAAFQAGKQQASQGLQSVVGNGSKLMTAIRAVLREFYGHSNEKLVEFGIQPLRTRSRRPVPEPEPTPEPEDPTTPPVE